MHWYLKNYAQDVLWDLLFLPISNELKQTSRKGDMEAKEKKSLGKGITYLEKT